MTTRKRSYAARLGILAVALALTSTCLVGGTMAKYATEVTGTGSATVAAWSFKVNGSNSTSMAAVDLASTSYTKETIADKRIAPGTKGSFTVEVDATGSEVAVDYTIAFSDMENKPEGLNFYSDAALGTLIDPTLTPETGTIDADAADKKVTKTIYWNWPYDATSGNTDVKDTTAGASTEKSVSFKISVTGTQVAPVTS